MLSKLHSHCFLFSFLSASYCFIISIKIAGVLDRPRYFFVIKKGVTNLMITPDLNK